jgi:hypothetical protein
VRLTTEEYQEWHLLRVTAAIKATRNLGLTTVTLDVDGLEHAFDARYNQGRRDGMMAVRT